MRPSPLRLFAALTTATFVVGCTLTSDLEGVDSSFGAGAGGLAGGAGRAGGGNAGLSGAAGKGGASAGSAGTNAAGAGGSSAGASGSSAGKGGASGAGAAGASGAGAAGFGGVSGAAGKGGNAGFGGAIVAGNGGAGGGAGQSGSAGQGGKAGQSGGAGTSGAAGQGGDAGASGQAGQAGSAGAGGAPLKPCTTVADCGPPPVCMVNACVGSFCGTAPSPSGSPCTDDGDKCNGVEQCNGQGACLHVSPVVVADAFTCTVDSCDPATGLVTHSPTGPVADDGKACTVESCSTTSGDLHTEQQDIETCIGTGQPSSNDFNCPTGYVVSRFRKCEVDDPTCCGDQNGYVRTCSYVCKASQTFCQAPFGGGACPVGRHPTSGKSCCLVGFLCASSGQPAFTCTLDSDSFTSCAATCPAGWHATTSTTVSSGDCAPSPNAGGGLGYQTQCDKNVGSFNQCGLTCPSTHLNGGTSVNLACPEGPGGPNTDNAALCVPK